MFLWYLNNVNWPYFAYKRFYSQVNQIDIDNGDFSGIFSL